MRQKHLFFMVPMLLLSGGCATTVKPLPEPLPIASAESWELGAG